MLWHVALFRCLLGAIALWAWWRGGAPEAAGAFLFVAAACLTVLVKPAYDSRYYTVDEAVLAVDVALLGALLILYYRADRTWPKWCVAAHLITTCGHAARAVDPTLLRAAYKMLMVFSGYAVLGILAVGVWRHQQRVRLHGADNAWSTC